MSSYWNIFTPAGPPTEKKKPAKKKAATKVKPRPASDYPNDKPKTKKKKAKKKPYGALKAADTIMSHKDKAY